jgi:hypothetical protein
MPRPLGKDEVPNSLVTSALDWIIKYLTTTAYPVNHIIGLSPEYDLHLYCRDNVVGADLLDEKFNWFTVILWNLEVHDDE